MTTVGAFLRVGGGSLKPLAINKKATIPLPQLQTQPQPVKPQTTQSQSQQMPIAAAQTQSAISKGGILRPQGGSSSAVRPEEFLKEKIKNLAVWLRTLQPVSERPDLANQLSNFNNLLAINKFIDWFRSDVIPKLPMGDKNGPAEEKAPWMYGAKAKAVVAEFLIGYGLLFNQFKPQEIERMLDFFYCFEDVISQIPK
jgi:hypothetical protein